MTGFVDTSYQEGDWCVERHDDGTEQVYQYDPWPPVIFIERLTSPKSRRKRWCVVSRKPPEKWRNAKYPPKLAGPFRELDAAKAAYLMIISAQRDPRCKA